jgi:hypothetical protein
MPSLPLGVQTPPPLPTQVHVWPAMPFGTGSVTSVLSAATVPVFVTVIV